MNEIAAGTVLSGFKIIEKIGSGGMGSVYKAKDELLDRYVAIKLMNNVQSEQAKLRFMREASALAKFTHHGIVRIFTFGEYFSQPYYVMEYVDGSSLDKFIKTGLKFKTGELNEYELREMGYITDESNTPYFLKTPVKHIKQSEHIKKVCSLIIEIAEALSEAHDLSIIHRDLKPSNIMLDSKGRVKIADFGLAKTKEEKDITNSNQLVGTLKYMSPEQFMGSKSKITLQTDIFAIGLIFYELLTFEKAVREDDSPAIIKQITNSEFLSPRKLNNNIPNSVLDILLKCLQKDQKKRYLSCDELADDLKIIINTLTVKPSKLWSFFRFFNKEIEDKTAPKPSLDLTKSSLSVSNFDLSGIEKAKEYFEKEFLPKYISLANSTQLLPILDETLKINNFFIDAHLAKAFYQNTDLSKKAIDSLAPFTKYLKQVDKLKLDFLKEFYIERNNKKALDLVKLILAEEPNNIIFELAQVECKVGVNNFNKAILLLKNILAKKPNCEIAELMLADVYSNIGNSEKTFETLNSLIERNDSALTPRVNKATYSFLLGDYANSINTLEEILTRDPTNLAALRNLSEAYLFLKAWKLAQNGFRRFISIEASSNYESEAHSYYNLYKISMKLKDFNQADKYLKIARSQKPEISFRTLEEYKDYFGSLNINFENDKDTSILKTLLKKHLIEVVDFENIAQKNSFYYFSIDENGNCILTMFNPIDNDELLPINHIQRYVTAAPTVPFHDNTGNILKTEYARVDNVFGKYKVTIHLEKPILTNTTDIITAEFDAQDCLRDNKFIFESLPAYKLEYQTIVVSYPKNFKTSKIENAEYFESETFVFVKISKRLFVKQKNSVVINLE